MHLLLLFCIIVCIGIKQQSLSTMLQLDIFGNHTNTQAKDPIWILKNRPAPDPNSPIIVSYGGGTNSTAMLIAMVLKGIKPDLILFADTGGELPET